MSDVPLTVLALSGIGVPPYSARGIKQTLTPINLIQSSGGSTTFLRRTVNGTLVNLVPPQMLKYVSEITGDDQDPPALDGIWPGLQVTVDCVAELKSLSGTLQRTAVDGSVRVDPDGFTYYRPKLTMLVTDFSVEKDEWGAAVTWKLSLEEV